MKGNVVSESPERYGVTKIRKPVLRNENSVWLHDVSPGTFSRLKKESGGGRKYKFAYADGEVEISGFSGHGVVLEDVSWETYKLLVAETGDDRRARFAYNDGELEIMSPYYPHERFARNFDHFVAVLAREYRLGYAPAGQLTCEKGELKKAIEPDSCYYLQHAKVIGNFVDLKIDPPPDLMIEVDMGGRNSVKKLPICLALKVPEHWRYNGTTLEIRVLRGANYVEVEESATFPGLPLKEKLPELLRFTRGYDILDAADKFRKWVRLHHKKATRKIRK